MRAIGATARRKTTAAQARIEKGNKAIRRRATRVGLLPAVVSALAAGLLVAYMAYQVVYRYTPTSDAKAAPIDITKVSLTIVAGVGGVVALVIAYRRQRDVEQSRFVERFGAAAAQLGATDVAVRIAGVYAMVGVADESDDPRRQQCIDVLCGYLRLPYDAEHGGSGRTKLVIKVPRVDGGQDRGETEEHIEYRQNDREVRRTIVRVMADHLRPGAEDSWSASNFDFRTAHLDDADFNSATFSGAARFDGATFSGTAGFSEATFGGIARFDGAMFNGDTWFDEAAFGGYAGFGEAVFTSTARFSRVTFSADTRFSKATFSGAARFDGTTFSGDARFGETAFSGYTGFGEAVFSGYAGFGSAAFGGETSFDSATFSGDTWFEEAVFSGYAGFGKVTFGGQASFVAADFGSDRIVFADPRCWGPPAPEFDWGADGAGKPTNVEPQDWPPALTPT